MSTKQRLNLEFKKLFVSYINQPSCNASQITSQFVKGKIDRNQKEQVSGYDEQMDKKIAHFWDSSHEFWKKDENLKYGITSDVELPITYANVASFKKQVAKATTPAAPTTSASTATNPITPQEESRSERKLRVSRESLIVKYDDVVEEAEEMVKKVQAILDANPSISTQKELDNLLSESVA